MNDGGALRRQGYEAVVGLEVHAELKTRTKLFCGCSTAFGAPPNTQCCPVCAGLPGGLVAGRLNRRAVELALLAGLALGCDIAGYSHMDRKHYFYPDLPRGYQLSQDGEPLCRGGYLEFAAAGVPTRVRIARVHLEEDAGKLLHTPQGAMLDCNRCGVPLIEIVTEPDLRSGAGAAAFLRELRAVLLACGISDCRMQEGSLRCDVNLSVRRIGEETLGTRTEIKNINSFAFVEKAIAYEAGRQLEELARTGQVRQRTLRYNPAAGRTEVMRDKERAADYRFLREPDVPELCVSRATVERLRRELPELPAARRARLQTAYGMRAEDAATLTALPGLAEFFGQAAAASAYPDLVLNLLLSDLLRLCPGEPFVSPVSPGQLAELADLAGEGSVNRSTAKRLLPRLAGTQESPRALAEREQLTQIRDPGRIAAWAAQAVAELPRPAADYRSGRSNALQALQGRLMALSGGRADPVQAAQALRALLETNREEEESHV